MSKPKALAGGLMLLTVWLTAGCASRSRNWDAAIPPQREWHWERCYEGSQRPLAELAVLWVASEPLALRVNSIDGVGVREATEYHLLPGYHVVGTQPVSRGNVTTTSDPATLGCTLEAGTVYTLTADVTWGQAQHQATPWGSSFSQPFQWSPRTNERGSFGALARAVVADDAQKQYAERPPQHWRAAASSAESGWERRTPQLLTSPRAAEGSYDIAEALQAGVVEAEASGAGMNLVSLRLKRKIDQPVHVTVPAGTFFACRGAAQNMVALAETRIDLQDDAWQPVMLTAACVDFARTVPQPSDTFLIQGPAHQQDLRKLMAVLCRETWPADVRPHDVGRALRAAQAAIWIVAGDTTYEHLGVVRRNPAGGGITALNPRSIDETDTAMAMRLVDEAGINIKKKAIWRDQQLIARGVSNPALRNWLERR